jgi:hypothetical protein
MNCRASRQIALGSSSPFFCWKLMTGDGPLMTKKKLSSNSMRSS